jgi:hypothetical protein
MYGRGLAPAALGPAAGSGGHLRRILGVYGHTPAARPGVWGLRPGVRKFSRGGALKGVNGRNGYVTVAPRALAALRAAC